MTIDEAIKYANGLAEEEEDKCYRCKSSNPFEIIRHQNNTKDYRQLAEWLKDLKMYQQRYLDALELLKEATYDFHKILPLISDCSFCSMYDKEKGECTGESALECADICEWRLHDKFLDVSF